MRTFLLALACLGNAAAATFQISEPTADRWNYPFASGGGTSTSAPLFGAIGDDRFDDRDSQMYLRFATTGIAPAGLGASNYQLTALTLTLTLSATASGTIYDPTFDPLASYQPGGVDGDAGRPIEVFGVGFRNGFTASSWQETSAFTTQPGGGLGERIRSAYAAGFSGNQLVDVSNNVADGFEVNPWAIGQVAGATPGAAIPLEAAMTFSFNLADANVLAYLQAGFDQGFIDLMVTSLYPAVQPGTGTQTTFPSFVTRENLAHDPASGDFAAGQLGGSLTVVPEPAAITLLAAAGLALLLLNLRRRHA